MKGFLAFWKKGLGPSSDRVCGRDVAGIRCLLLGNERWCFAGTSLASQPENLWKTIARPKKGRLREKEKMKVVIVTLLMSVFVLGSASDALAGNGKKMKYADAKARCLEEDPGLSGKSLQGCIKQKMKRKKRVN